MFGRELAEVYICGENQSKETASIAALRRVHAGSRPTTAIVLALWPKAELRGGRNQVNVRLDRGVNTPRSPEWG